MTPRRALACASGLLFAIWLISGPAKAAPAQAERVKKFVRQSYADGVPFDGARQFDSGAIPTLLEMLRNPGEERYRPNVVRTLGIIGDVAACQPMIQLLESSAEGELSVTQYRAKMGVLFALAYVVERNGKATTALDYLIESADPSVWARRGLTWMTPHHPTSEDRDRHLSTIAILALGLSAHPRALAALQFPETEGARKFLKERSDVVQTALEAYKTVAKMGLVGYYREQEGDASPKTRP